MITYTWYAFIWYVTVVSGFVRWKVIEGMMLLNGLEMNDYHWFSWSFIRLRH